MAHPSSAPFPKRLIVPMVVFIGLFWVLLAPLEFGGRAAYIIVAGTSMEPGLHRGDLAIVRQAAAYEVGDVVTYRHPDIGPVIHRIVGREGQHFIFKGDNNGWIDDYQPLPDELIGRMWFFLPGAGRVLERFKTPIGMAALAAIIAVVVLTQFSAPVGRRLRGMGRHEQTGERGTSGMGHTQKEELLLGVAILTALALGLAWLAFSRPLTRLLPEAIPYQHQGHFQYSATVPAPIYDGAMAATGDPLFRRLTNSVAITFDYTLATDSPGELAGLSRLTAELSDVSGWRRTLELQPERAFRGRGVRLDGALDLLQLQSLIDAFERETALQRQEYTVAIVAHIGVTGTLAGQPFEDRFAPRLLFRLDDLQMQVATPSEGMLAAALQPTVDGSVPGMREAPNVISFFTLSFSVTSLRAMALFALALAVGGMGAAGALLYQESHTDASDRIQARYGSLLIEVRDSAQWTVDALVEVASIEDLARLAEREGGVILHEPRNDGHDYFVRAGGMLYRYRHQPGRVPVMAAGEEAMAP